MKRILLVVFASILTTIFAAKSIAQDVTPSLNKSNEIESANKGALTNPSIPEDQKDVPKTDENKETKPESSVKQAEETKSTTETPEEHYFGFSAQLGVPHPINYGLHYIHKSKIFSAGISTGAFSHTQDEADLGISNSELALRWHPFKGSFYLGALVGEQKITGKKSENITESSIVYPVTAEIEIKSSYTTPTLGWLWGSWNGGFFAGMEFGWQTPSGVKSKVSSNANDAVKATQEYKDLEKDVTDAADKIGNMSLPHVILLRIGWLF